MEDRQSNLVFTIDGKKFSGTKNARHELEISIYYLRKFINEGVDFEYKGRKVSFIRLDKTKHRRAKQFNIREKTKLIPLKSGFKFYKGVFLEFNYKGILIMSYSKTSFRKLFPKEHKTLLLKYGRLRNQFFNKPKLGTNPFDYDAISSRQL